MTDGISHPNEPALTLLDEVSSLRTRLPGLLGTGPEASPAPLQPLARMADDVLGAAASELAVAALRRDGSWLRTVPRRLKELATELGRVVGEAHVISAQAMILADLAVLTSVRAHVEAVRAVTGEGPPADPSG